MTPKEFLKPTAEKILFLLIIFILFVPFVEISVIPGKCEVWGGNCPVSGTLVSMIIYVLSFLVGWPFFIQDVNYITLFLGLIASYLFSCFFATLGKTPKLKKRR